MVRFRRFVQDRTVLRSTTAPARWIVVGGCSLVVVVLTAIVALTGTRPASEAATTGGRITLDIDSGISPDQSARSTTTTAAPSTPAAPTTTAPPTSAPASPRPTPTASPPTTARPTRSTVVPPNGGIYGQVVASDGSPLPGLCVTSPQQLDPAVVRTAADGTFVLPQVAAGPASVELLGAAPGCAPLSGSTVSSRTVDVVADLWVPVLVTVQVLGR
jgi:hypothetical protein